MAILRSDYGESTEPVGNDTAETQTTTIDDEIWDQAYDAIPPCDSTPEVDRFSVLPVAYRKSDILKWWITRQTDFPKLSRLAADYSAIPASSVPAKRAISAGGRAFDGRARLHSSTFKAEICCRSWIKLLRSKGIPLPDDFRDEFRKMNADELTELAEQDDVIAYTIGEIGLITEDSDIE